MWEMLTRSFKEAHQQGRTERTRVIQTLRVWVVEQYITVSPPTHPPNPPIRRVPTAAHSNRLVLLYLPSNVHTAHPPTHPPTHLYTGIRQDLGRRALYH